MIKIVEGAFPIIEKLLEAHKAGTGDQDKLLMIVMSKIFFLANYQEVCKGIDYEKWINVFVEILGDPLESLSSDTNDLNEIQTREKSLPWKLKAAVSEASLVLL